MDQYDGFGSCHKHTPTHFLNASDELLSIMEKSNIFIINLGLKIKPLDCVVFTNPNHKPIVCRVKSEMGKAAELYKYELMMVN